MKRSGLNLAIEMDLGFRGMLGIPHKNIAELQYLNPEPCTLKLNSALVA